MCNYKYQRRQHPLEGKLCIYPALYAKYADKFLLTPSLPIDNEGSCIFHSKDVVWKNENQFTERFMELLKVWEDVKSLETNTTKFNFSGFVLCSAEKNFTIDNLAHVNNFDFTYCQFTTGFTLSNSKLSSLDLEFSHFHDTFKLHNVYFYNNINSAKATYDNGINILNCELDGYTFFHECVFSNRDKTLNCVSIKKCPSIKYLDFKKARFNTRVSIDGVVLNDEVVFDESLFLDEFYFHHCEVNAAITFKETEFSLSANQNPMYSTVDMGPIKLNLNGRIVFSGKKPLDDVVKGEMQFFFANDPEGMVFFENFNLNSITPSHKAKLFELEKVGKVEIGKGCRKYYCQTDTIIIDATASTQKLILDITTVFCNYFEIKQGYNLGIEIIERTSKQIKYFYFTDEVITKQAFYDKIMQNEHNLWQTFSDLTRHSSQIVSGNDMETKNCLIDIAGLFLKIGNHLQHNGILQSDVNNIFASITTNGNSSVDTQKLVKEIEYRFSNFHKNAPTLIIKNMGNNYYNHGNVEQFGENNYKTTIISDSTISDEQKTLIFETISDIQKEETSEKKESRLAKFIKDFGPTIGETAVKMIKEAIK